MREVVVLVVWYVVGAYFVSVVLLGSFS